MQDEDSQWYQESLAHARRVQTLQREHDRLASYFEAVLQSEQRHRERVAKPGWEYTDARRAGDLQRSREQTVRKLFAAKAALRREEQLGNELVKKGRRVGLLRHIDADES